MFHNVLASFWFYELIEQCTQQRFLFICSNNKLENYSAAFDVSARTNNTLQHVFQLFTVRLVAAATLHHCTQLIFLLS
jgi:hypothetical protein